MQLIRAGALLWLTACSVPQPPAEAAPEARPELALEDVTLRTWRGSRPQLSATAVHVELQRSAGRLDATTVELTLLPQGSKLAAAKVTGNTTEQSFDAMGGVTLNAPDGTVGKTEAAHLEGKQGTQGVATGSTPLEVHSVKDGRALKLDAKGFRYDVGEETATFEQVNTRAGAPE